MPEPDVTLGEVFRALGALDGRIESRFARMEERLDDQFVSRDTYAVQVGVLIDKVASLEEARRWAGRAFVAAFLFPVAVAVIAAVVVGR